MRKFKKGDKVIFGYNIGTIERFDELFQHYVIGSRNAKENEIVLATYENKKKLASKRLELRKMKWLSNRAYNSYQHIKSKYKDISIKMFV